MSDGTTPPPPPDPTPPPKGGSDRPGNGNLYAFLVGINNYANIRDLGGCIADLNRLEGFLKSRFKITTPGATLTNFSNLPGESKNYNIPLDGYNALKIYRLENEEATYTNIIQGFRSFLSSTTKADRVWFHFSGHGTESPTAAQFLKLENGKDQCLMCHDCTIDESTGTYSGLLADKELAVLISEVAQGEGGTPHIVVTIDACHSGGVTRDPNVKDRLSELPSNAVNRELSSYLDGIFNSQNPTIPISPHVVMTACNNLELAGEDSGGFFTTSLINALESVDGRINYSDLQIRTRAEVKKLRAEQTPQFDVVGGERAYTRFLEGTPEGDPDRYEVKWREAHRSWSIECGAIQGLPTTGRIKEIVTAVNEPVIIEIYQYPDELDASGLVKETALISRAELETVGPQYSIIKPFESFGNLTTDKAYYGVLNYFPAEPEYVMLKGTDAAVEKFIEDWKAFSKLKGKNIFFLRPPKGESSVEAQVRDFLLNLKTTPRIDGTNLNFQAEGETSGSDALKDKIRSFLSALNVSSGIETDGIEFLEEAPILHDLEVVIDGDVNEVTAFHIKDIRTGITWDEYDVNESNDQGYGKRVSDVLIDLGQIVNWRRLVALDNPTSSLKDKVKLVVNFEGDGGKLHETGFEGEDVVVWADPSKRINHPDREERYYNVQAQTIISGPTHEPLHVYLLQLWSWYAITAEAENKVETPLASGSQKDIEWVFDDQRKAWGIYSYEDADAVYFKLLVTSEEIDYHQLLQPGIDPDRGKPRKVEKIQGFKDWCTITMKVKMVREQPTE